MKLQAAMLPAVAAAAFFVGVRAETPWFGPKAANLVSFASSSTTVNPGQSIVIATVPANKKLVITDVNLQQLGGGGGSVSSIQLEQRDASGAVTLKVPESILSSLYYYPGAFAHSDGHGIVFESGTDAVLTLNVNSLGSCIVVYFVNGYLTDK